MNAIDTLAKAAVRDPEGLLNLTKSIIARAEKCNFDRGHMVETCMQELLRTGDKDYALFYYLTALIFDAWNTASTLRDPDMFQWDRFLHELRQKVPAYK